jgi:hypothetical protein
MYNILKGFRVCIDINIHTACYRVKVLRSLSNQDVSLNSPHMTEALPQIGLVLCEFCDAEQSSSCVSGMVVRGCGRWNLMRHDEFAEKFHSQVG